MVDLVGQLCRALEKENEFLLSNTHWQVKSVLCSGGLCKNVAAMRELQCAFPSPDWGAVPYLLTGLPMLGHRDPVEGMLPRAVDAVTSLDAFASQWQVQQRRVLDRVRSSGDPDLDMVAYE